MVLRQACTVYDDNKLCCLHLHAIPILNTYNKEQARTYKWTIVPESERWTLDASLSCSILQARTTIPAPARQALISHTFSQLMKAEGVRETAINQC